MAMTNFGRLLQDRRRVRPGRLQAPYAVQALSLGGPPNGERDQKVIDSTLPGLTMPGAGGPGEGDGTGTSGTGAIQGALEDAVAAGPGGSFEGEYADTGSAAGVGGGFGGEYADIAQVIAAILGQANLPMPGTGPGEMDPAPPTGGGGGGAPAGGGGGGNILYPTGINPMEQDRLEQILQQGGYTGGSGFPGLPSVLGSIYDDFINASKNAQPNTPTQQAPYEAPAGDVIGPDGQVNVDVVSKAVDSMTDEEIDALLEAIQSGAFTIPQYGSGFGGGSMGLQGLGMGGGGGIGLMGGIGGGGAGAPLPIKYGTVGPDYSIF